MILPSWATHLGIDEDGEVTVFDRAPVFLPPDSETCGVWALPDRLSGRGKVLVKPVSINASVYPVEVAGRLCVSLEHLPLWTAYIAFDSDGEVSAYDAMPLWYEWVGGAYWLPKEGRSDAFEDVGTLDASIARTLCFAISAPPEGPHTAT